MSNIDQQLLALEQRAKVGLVFAAMTDNERTFAFFQPQLHLLKCLRNGTAQRLAEKDAGLGGYEANAVFNAAARCLTDDAYLLPRADVAQILANAGIQQAFDAMATGDFATAVQFENSAVAAVNLHNEHTASGVVGDDGSDLLHAGPPIDVVAYFAQQGGAQ